MNKICETVDYIAVASDHCIFIFYKKCSKTSVIRLQSGIQDVEIKIKTNEEGTLRNGILHIAGPWNGEYISATTTDKRLIVWEIQSLSVVNERQLVKYPTSLLYASSISEIIVADKSGDVYSFPLIVSANDGMKSNLENDKNLEESHSPLLGHLSMILHMSLTDDETFIITCDRDEKIRVSHFPNCYNIHTFCLGHKEFVSQIQTLPGSLTHLISASGDKTIKLWDYSNGNCIGTLDVKPEKLTSINNSCKNETHQANEEDTKIQYTTFVSLLRACRKGDGQHVVALSFYRLTEIQFLEVKNGSEISYISSFSCKDSPSDFLFMETGDLLIYFGTCGSLSVLRLHCESPYIEVVLNHPVFSIEKEFSSELRARDCWYSSAHSLFKHKYDNFEEYQKKKEERIINQMAKVGKRKILD